MKREDRFRTLVNALLIELIYCWQSKTTEQLRVETAIMITRKHCGHLKNHLWPHPFRSDDEEITYFRYIQPQFTGRLCFYTILYEALVSAPKTAEEAYGFWENEQRRYQRFIDKNESNIEYIDSGCHEHDTKYFLRRNNRQPQQLHSKLYGIDSELYTTLDYLASALFAEKLYHYYVRNKTAEVNT